MRNDLAPLCFSFVFSLSLLGLLLSKDQAKSCCHWEDPLAEVRGGVDDWNTGSRG